MFISSQEWAFEYCFGNKQQHAENMDVKKNCVLSSYSVPTVLYTEVLKRNFAIIRVFIISQEWAFEYIRYYM